MCHFACLSCRGSALHVSRTIIGGRTKRVYARTRHISQTRTVDFLPQVTFTPAEQRFSERMLDYWLPFMRGDVMHEIDNGNDDQWTAFGSGKASGDYLNMTMGRDNGAVDDTQSADPPWTMVRGEFEKRCTLWVG